MKKTVWEERFERIYDAALKSPESAVRTAWTVINDASAFGSAKMAASAAAAVERVIDRRAPE